MNEIDLNPERNIYSILENGIFEEIKDLSRKKWIFIIGNGIKLS